MYDYSADMFHVGYLVPDIQAAMDDLGPSLGLNWTQVITREDQPCWTPERGAFTCPLTFAYSMEGPQRVELIQGVAGTVWDHGGAGHLHHAGVWCDVPALTDSLINQGWELVAAQKAPEDGYGSFTYVRSPSGFLLEPVTLNNKERMERWFAGGSL